MSPTSTDPEATDTRTLGHLKLLPSRWSEEEALAMPCMFMLQAEPERAVVEKVWVFYGRPVAVSIALNSDGSELEQAVAGLLGLPLIKFALSPPDVEPLRKYCTRQTIGGMGDVLVLSPKARLDVDFFRACAELSQRENKDILVIDLPGPAPSEMRGSGIKRSASMMTDFAVSACTQVCVHEGVSAQAPFTDREETCSELVDYMRSRNACLVRAPPCSGKTSLIALLHKFLSKTQPSARARTRCTCKALTSAPEAPVTWLLKEEFGIDSAALSDVGGPQTYLLLDEVQVAYGKVDNDFWGTFKRLLANPGEMDQHIQRYNEFARSHRSAVVSDNVASVISHLTSCHPGIVTSFLFLIYHHFLDKLSGVTAPVTDDKAICDFIYTLPERAVLSSTGAVTGYVDFWVNSELKWAIDVLIDGRENTLVVVFNKEFLSAKVFVKDQ
eukprot:m51a1_g7407 hypothetical protein (442) ;mRNA; f:186675-189837